MSLYENFELVLIDEWIELINYETEIIYMYVNKMLNKNLERKYS